MLDRIILSTDSDEIAALGHSLGIEVPFMRPPHLADDDSPMIDVVNHAISELEAAGCLPTMVVLLQLTAALRTTAHVSDGIQMLIDTGCDSVVSVVEAPRRYSPDLAMEITADRLRHVRPDAATIHRRQDARRAYFRDGTVYAFRRHVLNGDYGIYGSDCRPMILPADESLNLDTLSDWSLAESLLASTP